MSNESDDYDQLHDGRGTTTTNPVYSAVARSLTRGAALYFSRPIRLFRPSKSKYHLILQARFFISQEFRLCKQSQWLAVSQESRCQRWDVLECRFCHAACENAWGAFGE